MDPFLRNWPQVSDSGIGLLLVVAESLNAWINVTWSCSSCIQMTFSQGSLTGSTMGFLISCGTNDRGGFSTARWLAWENLWSVVFVRPWWQGVSLQDQYHVTYINGPLFHLSLFFSLSISTSGYICGFIDAHWTHPNLDNKTLTQFPLQCTYQHSTNVSWPKLTI